MAESFDYVAFAQNFEKRHGRPPTSKELETGIDPLEGIVRTHTAEETQAEMARINASYKPSFSERLKSGLSFLGRSGLKALILVIQTPIYLTLLFFNLIKSTIGVFLIWFVSKALIYVAIGVVMDLIHVKSVSDVPEWLRWIGDFFFGKEMFSSEYLIPNFFPHPTFDAWIIGIAIVFFALVATFSKVEET